MRKGDKVYINATSRPATKPNSWTEKNEFGNEVLKAGTMLFHVSEYEKIESFYPCYTAFSIQEPVLTGFCYMFKLKKDIEFEHIDKNALPNETPNGSMKQSTRCYAGQVVKYKEV